MKKTTNKSHNSKTNHMENKTVEEKTIRMKSSNCVNELLIQLDELTNSESIYFDQDVYDEKDEIKKKILSGEITME